MSIKTDMENKAKMQHLQSYLYELEARRIIPTAIVGSQAEIDSLDANAEYLKGLDLITSDHESGDNHSGLSVHVIFRPPNVLKSMVIQKIPSKGCDL